tara:strand:+ start:712 stop:1659 length:948 start_codon:yes stop_codon:yes gene_type:complete
MSRFLCYSAKKKKVYVPSQSNIILSWKSTKKTQHYHWWPMKETSCDCDDAFNNLYAKSGGLGKYDQLFDTKAVEYQSKEHFRSYKSTQMDAGWAGFCDCATTLSCLYNHPKHSIIVQLGRKQIVFTEQDIEALMIVASENAIQRWHSIYYGERYDGLRGEDKNEPYPTQLLKILQEVCHRDEPFAMDIECGESVWNYAFDSVIVSKEKLYISSSADVAPNSSPPATGKTTYYHFNIKSCGFWRKNQELWGWVNDTDGEITEGWISKWHPDFLWRKFAKEKWTGACILNPEVDASIVQDIYEHSIKSGSSREVLYM